MTTELVTKGIVHPKCQLINIEAGAMIYPKDKISGIATKGIIQTRCYLVTKEEIADAVDTKLSAEHGSGSWMGKVLIPLIKRLK